MVKTFKYLGVILTEEATGEAEFQARLNQGYAKLAVMKPVLQRKDIPARLKVRLIQAFVFPVVMYGCEVWSLSKNENCKLRAFETKVYRRALGIHYGESVKSRGIRACGLRCDDGESGQETEVALFRACGSARLLGEHHLDRYDGRNETTRRSKTPTDRGYRHLDKHDEPGSPDPEWPHT
jgi:hypothetical protein